MKKQILAIMVFVLSVTTAFSQIQVYTNNNVGICTSSTVDSKFSVNTTGSTSWTGYIYNPSTENGQGALVAKKEKPGSSSYSGLGLYGITYSGNGYAYGVKGYAYNGTVYTTGRSYGVYGIAGNASTGYNYGVYGILSGSNNGAGIFGTISGDALVDGKYAGYFYGNTKVNGTLYVNSTTYTSDKEAKKDIKNLEKDALGKLGKLQTISYKYKSPVELGLVGKEVTDTLADLSNLYSSEQYNETHFGLIAQELQTVYPDLVKKDPSGLLGIDYIGLIPVLIEALKEQQTAIETLNQKIVELENGR